METITGWHFTDGPVLGHGDNRPIVLGEWLAIKGPIVPCENGLHLSGSWSARRKINE